MKIEKTSKEIVLRLPADTDTLFLQKLLNYLKYKESVKKIQATEEQADELAEESKKRWWKENKHRFIK
jgi:hypothetical protein